MGTIETASVVDQFRGLVTIDPNVAAEIINSADYSILES